MRISNYLSLLSVAILACACENDFQPTEAPSSLSDIHATRAATNILSFKSVEEMEAKIHAMLEMEPEELEAWYREHNFKSQYDALYEAAEAIDRAKTLAEAQSIKEQYSEYFLYNDNPADDELFNPYLPNENPEYAYVCNIRGEVEIDGSVVNFNTLNSVEETHEYQLTHAAETRASVDQHQNYLKGTTKRHKFWAEGRYAKENRLVMIEFTAHRKNIFGWNKYACKYHIKIDPKFRDARKYGWLEYRAFVNDYFDGLKKHSFTPQDGTWTGKYPSHKRVSVGIVPFKKGAGISLKIYSDGTGVEAEGTLNIAYIGN